MTAFGGQGGGSGVARTVALLSIVLAVAASTAACGGDTDDKNAAAAPPVASASDPAPAQSPGTTASPAKGQASDTRTASEAYFQLPSGNLGCHMQHTEVRCDIRDQTYKLPAKPARCEGEYGKSLWFEKGKVASFICAGDSLLPAPEVLPYGTKMVVNRIQCLSEQGGVSCYDLDSGHGFALSRTEYRFLEPS